MPSERMIGNIYVYVQVDRIQGFVARVFETGEQIKFADRIEGRILPPNALSLSLFVSLCLSLSEELSVDENSSVDKY